jgi:acyl carrier protein
MSTDVIKLNAQQRDIIRDIIIEVLELEPTELTDDGNFVDDYGSDSLLAIEILARIEAELNVTIPQDDLSEIASLTGVYVVVERALHHGDSDG